MTKLEEQIALVNVPTGHSPDTSMKKNVIYQHIRQQIISGQWHESDKLPTEFEYKALYKVSRDTIRGAFKLLEEDGYINRVKAKGTFVRLPEVDENNRIISLLVGCDEFLRNMDSHFQQFLFDLIAAAATVGWGVVPVVYSRTNSPDDIWWENLARFNSNSRIVVNRTWFAPYFKTLSSIGARVAFINNDMPLPEELGRYTSHWINFVEEDSAAAIEAVEYLATRNCRKIGLAMHELNVWSNSLKAGFQAEIKRRGLSMALMNLGKEYSAASIGDFYRREKCDGLLLHFSEDKLLNRHSYREGLGLPQDAPVVALPIRPSNFYSDPKEKLVTVKYATREMAGDIVRELIKSQYIPRTFSYKPVLIF